LTPGMWVTFLFYHQQSLSAQDVSRKTTQSQRPNGDLCINV
jgi:hypothetical protein